jgi:prevent-host-death family protein
MELKEAKANLSALVNEAQREQILITRRGKPAAVVIGVEGQDLEEVILAGDVEFWKMIQERRQRQATLTSDDIRRSFGLGTTSKSQTKSRLKDVRTRRRSRSRKAR